MENSTFCNKTTYKTSQYLLDLSNDCFISTNNYIFRGDLSVFFCFFKSPRSSINVLECVYRINSLKLLKTLRIEDIPQKTDLRQ